MLAVRSRQSQVTRHRLEAVRGQGPNGVVVAAHGVERVDKLAPGRHESHASLGVVIAHDATARRPLAQPRRRESTEREWDAEAPCAPMEKGKVESMKIVILYHVGIGRLDLRDQPPDQVCLRRIAGTACLEYFRVARRIPHGDHEDFINFRVEARRLEVELQPAKLVEREIAKVVAAGGDEILLFGRQRERGVRSELLQMADTPAEPLGRTGEHSGV